MKIASKFGHFFRNAKQTIFPLMLCLGLLATFAAVETSAQNKPYATFQRLWIDYNVTQGGQKGMRIHTAFKTYNMKGMSGYLALYFQERDGTPLRDRNGKFNSANDTVAAYIEINPAYNPAVYEDLNTFMPYDELDLDPGNYELRIDASVIYKQGGLITRLNYYDFDYNDTSSSNKKPSATYDRVWAEYNVRRSGRLGMVVHLKGNVFDMKGKTGYIAFYFQRKNGTKLLTSNQTYRSDDYDREGQVVSYYAIAPGFENTVYEDASIFMPYDEFNLPRGTYELQVDVDLVDKDGGLLQHIALHDFSYEK